jgi:hypothetical protein
MGSSRKGGMTGTEPPLRGGPGRAGHSMGCFGTFAALKSLQGSFFGFPFLFPSKPSKEKKGSKFNMLVCRGSSKISPADHQQCLRF